MALQWKFAVVPSGNPASAIILGSQWEILAANASTGMLFELVGVSADAAEGLNLLVALLEPGGLGDHLNNVDEIRLIAWQGAAREALSHPGLVTLLKSLPMLQEGSTLRNVLPPCPLALR